MNDAMKRLCPGFWAEPCALYLFCGELLKVFQE